MKKDNIVLAVASIVAAAFVYVGGHLAYNEENYSMLVTTPITGEQWVTHEPGFYWLGWHDRTDRYHQARTVNFTRDAETDTKDRDFKW